MPSKNVLSGLNTRHTSTILFTSRYDNRSVLLKYSDVLARTLSVFRQFHSSGLYNKYGLAADLLVNEPSDAWSISLMWHNLA